MRRICGFLFLFLLLAQNVSAQDYEEMKDFVRDSQDNALIFRGRQPVQYRMVYNGHPYWDTKEFIDGTVNFNGKLYRDIPLNVDATTQDLLIKVNDWGLTVTVDTKSVESFSIADVSFVNLSGEGIEGIPEGFLEVVHEGKDNLYRRVDKALQSNVGNHNGEPIGYDDPNYNQETINYFLRNVSYYLVRDGKAYQTKGKKAFLRFFPEQKKEIRKYLRTNGYSSNDISYEQYCQAVLEYAES